jgi:hypothetical protein
MFNLHNWYCAIILILPLKFFHTTLFRWPLAHLILGLHSIPEKYPMHMSSCHSAQPALVYIGKSDITCSLVRTRLILLSTTALHFIMVVSICTPTRDAGPSCSHAEECLLLFTFIKWFFSPPLPVTSLVTALKRSLCAGFMCCWPALKRQGFCKVWNWSTQQVSLHCGMSHPSAACPYSPNSILQRYPTVIKAPILSRVLRLSTQGILRIVGTQENLMFLNFPEEIQWLTVLVSY